MIVTNNTGCWWQGGRRLSVYFMSLLLLYWQATDLSWPAFENAGWYGLTSMFDMRMKIKYWPPTSVFLWFACSQMLSHAAYQGTHWHFLHSKVYCDMQSKIKQANHVFLLVFSGSLWEKAPLFPPSVRREGQQSTLKSSYATCPLWAVCRLSRKQIKIQMCRLQSEQEKNSSDYCVLC